MNSMDFLKALSDISNEYLIEQSNAKKKVERKRLNFMNEFIGRLKLRNIISPVLISLSILFIMVINCYSEFNQKNIISKNEFEYSNQIEDEINFNEILFGDLSDDLNGKLIDDDVMNKFNFQNNLVIPKDFSLVRQAKIYEVELPRIEKYVSYQGYKMIFRKKQNGSNDYIELNISKNIFVLNFINKKNRNFKEFNSSKINGVEVKLFKSRTIENENDTQIDCDAYFKWNDYNVYIKAKGITHDEFVDLVKSVILEFKKSK